MTTPTTALEWLRAGSNTPDLIVIGAPISKASISSSEAWSTPLAFREALQRFPLWDADHRVDISRLRVRDAGDVASDRNDRDAEPGHRRVHEATQRWTAASPVVVVIGGDNSLTRPALQGLMEARPGAWGLITLDAHHDTREVTDGSRNGTPVRELIEGGLVGARVAQVGIHPLGNHRAYADWAHQQGVRSYGVSEVVAAGIDPIVRDALGVISANGAEMIYADLDVDVVDRAFAPACPASMPGGLAPRDLCAAAYLLGLDRRVVALDLCEVDANRDLNGITVRLMANAFMSFCAGVAKRLEVVAE